MTDWNDVTETAPDFAEEVQALFDAHKHKTMATLRKDGSPRISGIEMAFVGGRVVLGMMPQSLKARDVRRDGRVAIHSASVEPDPEDPAGWPGDAKISGLANEVTDRDEADAILRAMGTPEELLGSPVFRVEPREVVLTRVAESGDHLDVLLWKDGALTAKTAK
ncbi:pyridoxamine 5'-phosphate oxidase family protein [Actinocorallia sp. B10E7]|uniref:pyridoxamine 5'-phosphate oxidase family protein n=1 Tax=Actinocorallia sp. B10E7 TaxID=3153558 RepID=UPI00325EA93B